MEQSFDYIRTENIGITTEDKYPYKGKYEGKCLKYGGEVKIETYLHSEIIHRCRGLLEITRLGPVSIGVDATVWSSYGSGVFDQDCDRDQTNHAVLLVGFDEEYNWIIKNSWG